MILEEVGKRENITVSDEEVEKKVQELAGIYKKPVEEYKKGLRSEDFEGIKDSILTEKIFDFLIENAKITEKENTGKDDEKME